MKLKRVTMKEWEALNLPKTSMTISAVSSPKSKKSLPKETKNTKTSTKKNNEEEIYDNLIKTLNKQQRNVQPYKERSDIEKIRHRLKLLWYGGDHSVFYGCWGVSVNELNKLFKWVLDDKYKLLDKFSTEGMF